MVLKEQYINIPIKSDEVTTLVLVKDFQGNVVRYFDICLPTNEDNYTCIIPYDMRDLMGQELTFEPGINFITSSTPLDTSGLYMELNRSQFHFSSRWGWLNDPNGLFFYKGIYHLFYQHNPVGIGWGNMHWGHATSSDLIHWKEDSDILFPDDTGTMYSGSAVVDFNNDSGLQSGEDPAILLFYTAEGPKCVHEPKPTTQCLAYSTDGGNTFEKYDKNPILPFVGGGNRDPKVIWNDKIKQWIMPLYVEQPSDKFILLKSSNLLDWEVFQDDIIIENGRECPDMFPLNIEGEDCEKWILIEANGKYLIGDFIDGIFLAETETLTAFCAGSNHEYCYAGQTWSNMPNNRRVFIAWQRGDCDEFRFSQTMTIPLEFKLKRDSKNELYLSALPIEELKQLRDKSFKFLVNDNESRIDDEIAKVLVGDSCWDVEMKLSGKSSGYAVLGGEKFFIDIKNDKITFGDVSISLYRSKKVRVIIDRASLEIFVGDGRSWSAKRRVNSKEENRIKFETPEIISHISMYSLNSIWNILEG